MKCLIFVLLFLFIHTLLRGQEDWGKEIKKAFRKENYKEVIRLCNEDAKSYSESRAGSTDYDLVRNRIWIDAKKCLGCVDSVQKVSDPKQAKILLENIIKIREEIWFLVGENEPVVHPRTNSLLADIKRRPSKPVEAGGNEKELAETKELKLKLDSIQSVLRKNNGDMAEMKSILREQVYNDSAYQALQREREKLQKEYDALVLRVEELDSIIQLQKKGNFLPLGIKQFRNDKKALGCTFLVSEIAVPVALGVGLGCAAHQNYRKHKAQEAQTLSDHRDYYKKYKNYHRAAIWASVVAEALVYGVNVLCNYYCPVKKPDVALRPTVGVDCRGNVQAGIGISFNF